MAKSEKGAKADLTLDGQDFEGHGDKSQPSGIQSPATFAPLSKEPTAANVKTPDIGKKGHLGG